MQAHGADEDDSKRAQTQAASRWDRDGSLGGEQEEQASAVQSVKGVNVNRKWNGATSRLYDINKHKQRQERLD